MILVRVADGKPNGPYKNWPASKGPILLFALDCAADKWMDLGHGLRRLQGPCPRAGARRPRSRTSRRRRRRGKLACETKDTLPKADLP
jgi:hypothetical protein